MHWKYDNLVFLEFQRCKLILYLCEPQKDNLISDNTRFDAQHAQIRLRVWPVNYFKKHKNLKTHSTRQYWGALEKSQMNRFQRNLAESYQSPLRNQVCAISSGSFIPLRNCRGSNLATSSFSAHKTYNILHYSVDCDKCGCWRVVYYCAYRRWRPTTNQQSETSNSRHWNGHVANWTDGGRHSESIVCVPDVR
jgi:hypothetical protein